MNSPLGTFAASRLSGRAWAAATIRVLEELGLPMRRLLPSRAEIVIFAVLAVLCTIIVSMVRPNSHDLGFAALAGPIFLVAACMGLRRSPAWTMEDDAEEKIE